MSGSGSFDPARTPDPRTDRAVEDLAHRFHAADLCGHSMLRWLSCDIDRAHARIALGYTLTDDAWVKNGSTSP